MIKLRDYQTTDIQAIESAWEDNNSILYQLPTGGGKSVVLSKIVSDHKDEKIIIFAHKRRLLTQLKNHLSNVKIQAGLLIASTAENMDSNIIIVSIRTAVKDTRLDKLLERDWDRVIIDEARNSRTNSYDKVLKAIEAKNLNIKKLGVDATPFRRDRKRLDEHFDCMVCSTETTASLIEKGYLAKYKTYVAPIGKIEEEVAEVANDYQQQQLSHYMRQPIYLNYVVETYKKYGKNRQAVVFAVDKEHSKILQQTFVEHGLKSVERIDSSMSVEEIERITESYEKKETQILINVEMLTEGVDLPDTGVIIGARPTKSLTLYLQMVGRGTRLKADGSELIVLDCCGWTEAFGQLSSPKHWSLNPEIDPNNPRLNNRVVGKRIDGTYEEDLSDFIGEVVEMTPEEYLSSVQNGLERAEKINEKIDERKIAIMEQIYQVIESNLKGVMSEHNHSVEAKREEYRLIFTDKNNTQKENYYKTQVVIHLGHFQGTRLHSEIGGMSSNKLDEYMRMSKLNGRINELLLDHPKVEMQILELFEQVKDLEKTKINLEAFKEAAKNFTQEQFEKKVDDWCREGKEFVLTSPPRKDNWFKGYSNDRINSFKVIGNQVNSYSNTIEITLESYYNKGKITVEEKKYIKGEKIYEILKQGKWKEIEEK